MTAGDDEDVCPVLGEHLWSMTELHLSTEGGAESVKRCLRCDAVVYEADHVRRGRAKLEPPRAVLGE